MPLSGWIMAGYFWAIILTGVALAIVGWRRRERRGVEEAQYVVLRERAPEPWVGPSESPGRGPEGDIGA